MVTKRELKKDIYELLDICIELNTMLGFYCAKVEDDAATIKKLRKELKIAKRNEPIFTSERYDKRILAEENKQYKELNKALKEENFKLTARLDELEAIAKKKPKGPSKS